MGTTPEKTLLDKPAVAPKLLQFNFSNVLLSPSGD